MTARTEEQKAMKQMRQGRAVRLLALLSLTLFVLTGCGGDGTGDNSGQASSRLTLRLTTANQTLSNTRPTALPIQAQLEPTSTRLRVEVSAADLADPIVANCTLPNPTPNEPSCRNIGGTDEAILLEVALQVPRGNDRRIVVTILDASGAQTLRGEDTVDLTASDAEVTINLSPIFEVSIGSPADPVAPGTTFTVPVTINTGGTSLVSYLFELTFDPAIVVVTEITGSAPFDDPVHDPIAFVSGSVRFAANNSTFAPASGLLNVANITFEVVAEAAGTSALTLAFPPTPGGTGVLVTDRFAAIEDVTFVSGTVTTP
jgi:Cohesin domain